MHNDYSKVTEISNDEVTSDQIFRIANRYQWAADCCHGKRVLEVCCGSGQGLGLLSNVSESLSACDITSSLVHIARAHYPTYDIRVMDAMNLTYAPKSFDIIIIFEAIYYLRSLDSFVDACKELLSPNGKILISMANCALYDFNPSPYSTRYFNSSELADLMQRKGFNVKIFGSSPSESGVFTRRVLRPLKLIASRAGIIPKTMNGKKLLKRLVYGKLELMPPEITRETADYVTPKPVHPEMVDTIHKVIYCEASMKPS